jgi:hypothetical protein
MSDPDAILPNKSSPLAGGRTGDIVYTKELPSGGGHIWIPAKTTDKVEVVNGTSFEAGEAMLALSAYPKQSLPLVRRLYTKTKKRT